MNRAINLTRQINALDDIYAGPNWSRAMVAFSRSRHILYAGHGGNLAIADHAAIDCTRISLGAKIGSAPGSAVMATSLINDGGWSKWLLQWVVSQVIISGSEQACLVMMTSTGSAEDITLAIEVALSLKLPVICITGRSIPAFLKDPNYIEVLMDVETYHDAEMLTLGLTYDLLAAAGFECPKLKT